MKLKNIVEDINNKSSKSEKAAFLEEVAKFNEYGASIYRSEDLKRVAEAITNIVNQAEKVTLEETQDWFDEITVKRNLKTIKDGTNQFNKTVAEISKLQQRLESIYEEIGHNLGRYYEIK